MKTKLKAYKGFDENLCCRGFQYEEGKTFETDKAELCETGFHACENPLDCFGYYDPANSVFHEVELEGVSDKRDSDSKVVAKKITIGAKIDLFGMVQAEVEYIKSKVDWDNAKESNTGYQSAATNTGYSSAATNTGYSSAATNTGYRSAATNTGDYSAATNTGNYSAATNTGYSSAATNTGNYSAATNTGYRSAAEVSGKDSIAIVTGKDSKARGALGCWLVLTERDRNWQIKEVRAVKVDGEIIKPDTWYKLENGDVKEAE